MIAHPLADAFPMMSPEEFDGLKTDIKAHGIRHGIVVFEGKILDGRNRKQACQDLGIPCPERPFDPDTMGDPAEYVASENIHRRHLTQAQLTIAAERLATALAGRPRKTVSGDTATDHAVTIVEAARLTGAAVPSVRKVRKVRKDAVPEVQDAMDEGAITVTAATNLSRRPAAEQLEIMKLPAGQIATVAAGAAPVGEAVPLNPAGGRVGPKVMLARQMTLPDLAMIQHVVKDWGEHESVIPELDPAALKRFMADLRKSRTAYTRLIELIQLKTKEPDAPTPRSSGHDKGADVPTTAPVKRGSAAPKTAVRKNVKTPAKPRSTSAVKAATTNSKDA